MKSKIKTVMEQIKKIARDENIPVFGTAPASEMASEKPGHRPGDLLPGAQGLLCFGIPVPKGVYNMPAYTEETVWRSQNLNYRRIDTLSMRFAGILEKIGEIAVPIYGCLPMGLDERGAVVGYVNQLRMAEVTGIGIIGKNSLLINHDFGSTLMLGGLITTAVLPRNKYPDTDEPGCPSGCRACADACPVNAIMPDEKKVKIMRCLFHTAKIQSMSSLKFIFLRAYNKDKAARYMNLTSFDEHTFHVCSRCVSICPYGCPRL